MQLHSNLFEVILSLKNTLLIQIYAKILQYFPRQHYVNFYDCTVLLILNQLSRVCNCPLNINCKKVRTGQQQYIIYLGAERKERKSLLRKQQVTNNATQVTSRVQPKMLFFIFAIYYNFFCLSSDYPDDQLQFSQGGSFAYILCTVSTNMYSTHCVVYT